MKTFFWTNDTNIRMEAMFIYFCYSRLVIWEKFALIMFPKLCKIYEYLIDIGNNHWGCN